MSMLEPKIALRRIWEYDAAITHIVAERLVFFPIFSILKNIISLGRFYQHLTRSLDSDDVSDFIASDGQFMPPAACSRNKYHD